MWDVLMNFLERDKNCEWKNKRNIYYVSPGVARGLRLTLSNDTSLFIVIIPQIARYKLLNGDINSSGQLLG